MEFCSLHHHTTCSTKDGIGPVDKHFDRAAELGIRALGLTEHGNVSSHAAAERASARTGVKFIPGLEAYSAPIGQRLKCHQTILAMNAEGYESLNRIVTQSYRDFYQFPTVTWENLKENNRGLIVTSGCASSLISCKLLGGKFYGPERVEYTDKQFESALRVARQYKKVFGDRYYLEVQRFPDLERVRVLNGALQEISRIFGIPLVATADVHYCHAEETEIFATLHAIRRNSTADAVAAEWEGDLDLSFPESDEIISEDLLDTGLSKSNVARAIQATSEIADRCNVPLPKSRPLVFPLPEGSDMLGPREYLEEQIAAGIDFRANFGKFCDGPEYEERIKHELSVITLRPEFIDYFLFLADLIEWAKNQGIPVGPGRGSAAASLVCYLLRITEIDPMTVPTMVFERFMDPSRTDLPDIDIDISDEDRGKLVYYLRQKYGRENVANVANIIRFRGKTALNDVGKAHRVPNSVLKPFKDRIEDRTETDDRVDDSVQDVFDRYSDVDAIADGLRNWPALRQAASLEGDTKTYGTHAAGVVVASDPITKTCAMYERTIKSGSETRTIVTIPYDKRDAEYLGMMKADLLGLATMGMIGQAVKFVNKMDPSRHLSMDEIYALELNDEKVLSGFQTDDLTGIFQFEGGTTRGICKRVIPESITDLSDINALSRPGPLFSGAVDRYIKAKHGELEQDSVHPAYDQHVTDTYGQLVYQEQIMKVLRDLAGFDTIKVLRVRKIIGKKLGEHQFAELWGDFRDGCATNGIDEETAWKVWGSITTAAGYAFNIAHSYAYAVIAYWSMWLKVYYPTAFFAASLMKCGDGKKQIPHRTALIVDAERHGQKIMAPDPFLSHENWDIHKLGDKKKWVIRAGFLQIPGIGQVTAEEMYRQAALLVKAGCVGWDELAKASRGVGPKTLQNIKEFVAQDDPFGAYRINKILNAFREELANGDYDAGKLPAPEEFFLADDFDCVADWEQVAWVGLVANIEYRDVIEYERSKTGKSVEEILETLDNPTLTKHAVAFCYDETDEVAIRFGRKIYPRWEKLVGNLKEDHHIVAVWGKKMPGMGNSLIPIECWVLDPE